MSIYNIIMGHVPVKDGSRSSLAAPSAYYLTNNLGKTTDGVYWIDLPTAGPTQVYCILDPAINGGGWMMAMKSTRGTTFNYTANYWNTINTLNPTQNNRNDGDAKFNTMNYFQSKDIMALWPDITTVGGGLGSGSSNKFSSWTWLENDFYAGSRTTLVDFFNTAGTYNSGTVNTAGNYGGYYKGFAKNSPNWGNGVFSSQTDINFYGFNFKNYPGSNAKVRWGFGWNENGEGNYTSPATLANAAGGYSGSDDVSGGIGMDSSYGNYSSGDYLACCNDTTGINRSARVEIYVR